ncbi:AI-2E family transporter [Helicobacter trogontum]|uniref:AI-2E family transporter n=1 Tax=Helicobacter trogontum TaxID=50960 RepID=A0A099VJ97_9HELI|nr:AI-2E family transporter [Helicobacter trogontum]MCI5786292.1 AI-2E family transporter [Helicobacter trogontum]TLD83431.1 AI-2E family transporter [Helicobacter trogontum]TLD98881.1 AI-2E family transporter [Helicobacter trogontum]
MQSKIFFGLLFLSVCIATLILYQAYLFNMLIAFLLCVATIWLKHWLQRYIKNVFMASLCALLLMVGLVFIPVLFVCYRAFLGVKMINWVVLQDIFDSSKIAIQNIFAKLPFMQDYLPSLLNEISFGKISSIVLKISSIVGENGVKFIVDGFVIIVFLFVFFYFEERFYAYMKRILPFEERQISEVTMEVSGTLRLVFLSTFFNVVMQGTAFGVIAYFFGFDGVLLGILYGICSMIPIVGGVIVWLPICAILVYQGDIKGAIIVGLYSAVFIGFVIDNVVKPWLISIVNKRILRTPLQINEFVIFFAILAGIGAFGFWGIIIGPAITALFIALLRVYEHEFCNENNKIRE